MEAVLSLSLGYLFGSLNPAAIVSKYKQINLREHGSGNLGATNTMVVFGLKFGVLVLIFDLLKAILAGRIARILFPQLYFAKFIAGCGAVLGHIFPFYMDFQGGKGVACLAGLLMGYDFLLFLGLLGFGIFLMFAFDYGVVAPVTVAAMLPVIIVRRTHSLCLGLLATVVSISIITRHRDNFRRIKNGEEPKVRAYFSEKLRAKCLPPHEDNTLDE